MPELPEARVPLADKAIHFHPDVRAIAIGAMTEEQIQMKLAKVLPS